MTQLYDQHCGPLLAYALQLTGGDRHRAEDVVQETLLRAWRHPEALEPHRGSPRAWLRTVARNIAFDEHRARQSRPSCWTDWSKRRAVNEPNDDGVRG
jgi:RNA polymerase sigma-70 factor, ECF subfamily